MESYEIDQRWDKMCVTINISFGVRIWIGLTMRIGLKIKIELEGLQPTRDSSARFDSLDLLDQKIGFRWVHLALLDYMRSLEQLVAEYLTFDIAIGVRVKEGGSGDPPHLTFDMWPHVHL